MTTTNLSLTLNNGVRFRPRVRRVPDPARRDRRGGRGGPATATGTSTPPPPTATNARSARGSAAPASPRDEVFIETKIWISDYGYDETLHAFEKSAGKLGVEQIDLLLLHQPLPTAFDRTLGAYRALETLLADGKVRAIGVSNFMPEHLDRLLAAASVVPAVNQIEVHPYFQQPALQRLHTAHGILTQAWSPIGGITVYRGWREEHLGRPDTARDRAPARQVPRAGDAPLAPAGGPLGDPEVGQARAHRRELRRIRLRALPGSNWRPSTRSTPAFEAARSPTASPSRPSACRSRRPE